MGYRQMQARSLKPKYVEPWWNDLKPPWFLGDFVVRRSMYGRVSKNCCGKRMLDTFNLHKTNHFHSQGLSVVLDKLINRFVYLSYTVTSR